MAHGLFDRGEEPFGQRIVQQRLDARGDVTVSGDRSDQDRGAPRVDQREQGVGDSDRSGQVHVEHRRRTGHFR
nr:hypothetical protein [Mycobacterium europaeum]MEA1161387.1 hypothetical protein [Mycobacterium europaeum]